MDFKKVLEKRAELFEKMQEMAKKIETEQRSFSAEENQEFDNLEKQIKDLDETLEKMQHMRSLEKTENKSTKKSADEGREGEISADERAFANYIRGVVETRAESNLTFSGNNAVIPQSIANKIISKVKDTCPIYSMATPYNVKGTISIPYYDEETGGSSISMAYADEFTELESNIGSFKSIELKGYLSGVLALISRKLLNNSDFDLLSFVVSKMAEAIHIWIENELLNGTSNKILGLSTATNVTTAKSATTVTADELIDLQESVVDVYQESAVWIMNRTTRTAIRKLKDNDGNYLLNRDATSKWGYTLFGKDVYTSDSMPEMAAGKAAIYYGDMSGLALKTSEEISIEVLREKYATSHAVGVIGWCEIDAQIENQQKIAVLKMAAA